MKNKINTYFFLLLLSVIRLRRYKCFGSTRFDADFYSFFAVKR